MNRIDDTLRELGQLYDLHKELARFTFKSEPKPRKATESDSKKPPPTSPKPGS